jgi:hypothetical protein
LQIEETTEEDDADTEGSMVAEISLGARRSARFAFTS